jgi:adenylate cyclase
MYSNSVGCLTRGCTCRRPLRGQAALARAYADSARVAYEDQVRDVPDNATPHALLGVTLAYLGRRADAIREGKRGVELAPMSKAADYGGYSRHQLARTYILLGEYDKALEQLEPLVEKPYLLSPGWLRIDPTFAPLRGHPRFERMVTVSE